ncbi:serine hydrolase [Acetobacterium paludosum]|uniref:Serine hydrolase n=1 Tax=Acetobacterium paludosum TaxID=52693 RepID=A0A923HWX7_9FIRM|nr:serine hydrolase domain-containing protein [Acetobacterium paludosum]MBC3887456.1 serine hydrolase [Acetobacterium paludosum]
MTEKKKWIIGIIAIIASIAIVYGGVNIIINKDKDYIDKIVEKYSPQGAAVAIIENGKIAEVRNYGYANVESKIQVGNETKFKIASISKTTTAYAVMQLVDAGKLDLDAPVSTYLTKWTLPDTQFDENKVTLRTLMSHTSGITGSDESGYNYPLPAIEDVLRDRNIRLQREPGEVFEYSEFAGFGICQLIIEEVTGEKFEDYMKNTVFKNLGMNDTNYDNESSDGSLAVPYAGINKPIAITPIVMNGGGGVTTTAGDLAKFTIALINYYQNGNREMFQPQKNTESAGGEYALGIIPRTLIDGKTVYEHNGTLTGWNAQLVMEPTSQNGIVILTNSDKAYYLTYELMEKWGKNVLGEKVVDTFMLQITKMITYVTTGLLVILLIFGGAFLLQLKKGKLVLAEKAKRNKRYLISGIGSLLLMALYFSMLYTEVPFELAYNMRDYYLFTFFPPSFVWINVILILFAVLLILRSGYERVTKNK